MFRTKNRRNEITERKERDLRKLFDVVNYDERAALFGKVPLIPLTEEQVNHFLYDYPNLNEEAARRASGQEELWDDINAGRVSPREAMDRTLGVDAGNRLAEDLWRNVARVKKLFTPGRETREIKK